jgi:serine/threonine protein kinase/Tol biopolymer transport system component
MQGTPGSIFGSYEIRGFIGAGGMGEVYRAHDPRLGRDVALKLLPATFAHDVERLQRFEHEARATAALNHPNITAIYDIGTSEGQPFVVSELLEGDTLRSQLASGPLPVRVAVSYAQQIAHGLSAAHRRGIIHRDLKPENLFVIRQGLIKILDFGLAKQTLPLASSSEQHETTTPGIILGTVGYMSPEQVRGERLDHRSDIFALGIVLYEMISGHKPFQGASPADTLSAILKEHPPELSQIVRDVPPAIERIVTRCLEKDRENRFQSAADLGFALDAVSGFSSAVAQAAPPPRRRWKYLGAAMAGAIVVAIATLAAAPWFAAKSDPEFHQLTFRRGTVQGARFAPDGQTIVYGAAWEGNPTELFSTRPEAPEARSLQLSDAGLFALSSKGEMAVAITPHGFGLVTGTLARASLAGGPPRQLAKGIVAADWSPNGGELAAVQSVKGHDQLQYPLGTILYDPSPGNITHIRFSPSGDAIAFIQHPVSGDTAGSVMLTDLNGHTTVLSKGWNSVLGLGWSPDGREVWFTGTRAGAAHALHAVTRSGRERLLVRAPATLTLHDVSRDGRVLLTRDAWGAGVIALTPGAARERDLSWLDGSTAWDLSADGTTMIIEESWEAGGAERGIYLRTTDGAPAVRLGEGVPLALSPDKQWVIATNVAGDRLSLLPTGAGQTKMLPRGGVTNFFPTARWRPDGRDLLFSGAETGKRSRIFLQSVDGGDPRAVTPEGVFGRLAILPDGNRFVTRGLDRRLAIYSIDGGAGQPIRGAEPSDLPIVVSPDGSTLYVHADYDVPAQIASIDLRSGERTIVRKLLPPDPSGISSILRIVMTPDARSYAYTYVRAISALYLVDGIR